MVSVTEGKAALVVKVSDDLKLVEDPVVDCQLDDTSRESGRGTIDGSESGSERPGLNLRVGGYGMVNAPSRWRPTTSSR
jgi:hypothetical protein